MVEIFPELILAYIFTYLPVEDVVRCRAVCRRWSASFNSMTTARPRHGLSDFLVLMHNRKVLPTVSSYSFHRMKPIEISSDWLAPQGSRFLLAGGGLVLCFYPHNIKDKFLIGNPVTQQWIHIPAVGIPHWYSPRHMFSFRDSTGRRTEFRIFMGGYHFDSRVGRWSRMDDFPNLNPYWNLRLWDLHCINGECLALGKVDVRYDAEEVLMSLDHPEKRYPPLLTPPEEGTERGKRQGLVEVGEGGGVGILWSNGVFILANQGQEWEWNPISNFVDEFHRDKRVKWSVDEWSWVRARNYALVYARGRRVGGVLDLSKLTWKRFEGFVRGSQIASPPRGFPGTVRGFFLRLDLAPLTVRPVEIHQPALC